MRSGPRLRALGFRLGETPTELWIAKTSPNQFRGVGLGAAVVFLSGVGCRGLVVFSQFNHGDSQTSPASAAVRFHGWSATTAGPTAQSCW